MRIETANIEVMSLTFLFSIQANLLNAFPAEEEGDFGCNITSLVEERHWRILDLQHFSALYEGHDSNVVTSLLISFYQHISAVKCRNQTRKLTMQV